MRIGKNVSVASKQSMNLIIKEEKTVNPVKTAIIIVVILAVLAVVGKFGVLDRYEKVDLARQELTTTQSMYDSLVIANAKYDDVVKEYNRYSFGGMTDEEKAVADRGQVLDLVEELLIPAAQVESVNLSGNTLSVQMSGITLKQASSLMNTLTGNKLVKAVSISTANTDQKGNERSEEDENKSQEATITIIVTLADNAVATGTEEGGEQ